MQRRARGARGAGRVRGAGADAEAGTAERNGTITGQIVDAATGRAVNGAVVTLKPQPQRILTAADGRFVFTELPPGAYTIVATRRGYVEGASGRRRPGGTSQPVTLTPDEPSADAVVRMWKTAVITGVVTDESGDPVVGAQLRALERSTVAGQSRFTAAGAPAFTDDRGVYRFSDLVPGEYLVATIAPRPAMTRSVYRTIATEPRGGNVRTIAIPDPRKRCRSAASSTAWDAARSRRRRRARTACGCTRHVLPLGADPC